MTLMHGRLVGLRYWTVSSRNTRSHIEASVIPQDTSIQMYLISPALEARWSPEVIQFLPWMLC